MQRIVTARQQVEMLSPWRIASGGEVSPSIHDLIPNRFSDGNGRWDYRHEGSSGDNYTRHEYSIHPASSPASHSYTDEWGKPHTVHYDPSLTGGQAPRPGRFNHEWDDPSALRNEIGDLNPPQGMLWRGMSREEYDEAKSRGYFESRGGHNLGDVQKGMTFFSTKPEQAGNYASWFAPQAYKPTFTHPAHVVGILDRPDLPRGADPTRPDPKSSEVAIPGRIPFSEVTHHYVGRPSVITTGSQGVSEGWRGYEESGGTQPSSHIKWEPAGDVGPTRSALVGFCRKAERADDFEWERGFDGGGDWELITHTPDGNPVEIETEPARGQRTHTGATTLPYLRNNNGVRQHSTGNDFGQADEPWGRYMSPDSDEHHQPLQQGWERGTVSFDNPLFVPHEYGGWKKTLSDQYGATGRRLSEKLLADGYDGVISHDKYGIGEIVDVRPKGQRGHHVSAPQ